MHAQSGWDQEIDLIIAEKSTFLPSKTPGLLLLCVLGHCAFVLWRTIQSILLHLAESGQRVYPYTLQNSSGCFCPLPCHQTTPVTQCHWKPCTLMPSHCSTMFHRWCCMLWIMSCSKPSPYFCLPVILIQVDVNFRISKECFSRSGLFKKIFFCQSLIWPCLHLVVNSLYFLSWSFDCRLWQWHSDLLAGCC